ncbi:MAG TPA: hypothetical protein VHL80_11135 [Polyangia bacterium]|nr:hypothetical protein [Polyangia bacterium]
MRKLAVVSVLASLVSAAGCGPASCPAGETSQDTVVSDTHCGGSVTAPAALALPATIPDRCSLQPSTCALVNECLETGAPCSRVCLAFDPPFGLSFGITGLPIAGAVTLPDPRLQIVLDGDPVTITGGTFTVTQKGNTVTVSYAVTFTTSDGSQVSIASGTYKATEHLASECGPV